MCRHSNWSRAWREYGMDYQRCLTCGRTRPSTIQFADSVYVAPQPKWWQLLLAWIGVA